MAEITIEGRQHLLIRCGRCLAPMLAEEAHNNERNDDLEICPRCTRAVVAEVAAEVPT